MYSAEEKIVNMYVWNDKIMHFILNYTVFSLFFILISGNLKYQYQNWYCLNLILIFDIFNRFDVHIDIDILIPKHIDISIIDIWYWYIYQSNTILLFLFIYQSTCW